MINVFSKVTGYKINMPKTAAFIDNKDKQTEKEIGGTIPFITASKINKNTGNKPKRGRKRTHTMKT